MAVSISSLLGDCLRLFNDLVAHEDLSAHNVEVSTTLWTDELGRLRIWAANIGAHQTGQSSLDYRLRDASHIKDQIIRLLKHLRLLLVDLQEALAELPEEAENQLSDDEDTTEVEQIYHGLVEVINSLFQMSMLIRRPAHHDRLLGTSKEDFLAFEPYDRKHVQDRYPQAADFIVDRLGTANSRRRADLKYRERHHAKLSQGINKLHTSAHSEGESTVFSETIATEFEEPNIQSDDAGSNSGLSQTSYAPTLLEGGKAITVPPPPKESANEQPFECPYCFFITIIKDKYSWARHVFRDIMPYICVFTGCPTPNKIYDSRREWYHHLTDSHIARSHQVELQECPLCHEIGFSTLSFERHLGRHLEELALFAIPRPVGDDDIDSDKSRRSSGRNTPFQAEQVDLSSDRGEDRLEQNIFPDTTTIVSYPSSEEGKRSAVEGEPTYNHCLSYDEDDAISIPFETDPKDPDELAQNIIVSAHLGDESNIKCFKGTIDTGVKICLLAEHVIVDRFGSERVDTSRWVFLGDLGEGRVRTMGEIRLTICLGSSEKWLSVPFQVVPESYAQYRFDALLSDKVMKRGNIPIPGPEFQDDVDDVD